MQEFDVCVCVCVCVYVYIYIYTHNTQHTTHTHVALASLLPLEAFLVSLLLDQPRPAPPRTQISPSLFLPGVWHIVGMSRQYLLEWKVGCIEKKPCVPEITIRISTCTLCTSDCMKFINGKYRHLISAAYMYVCFNSYLFEVLEQICMCCISLHCVSNYSFGKGF